MKLAARRGSRRDSTRLSLMVDALAVAVVIAAIISCSEPLVPTGAVRDQMRRPQVPKRLSFGMQQLPPITASLAAEPEAPDTIAAYPFPEGIIVDIQISVPINLASHSMAAPINYSGPLDYRGIRVPLGNGCLLQATVMFTQISGAGNPFPNTTDCLIPRTFSDYTVRAKVGGFGIMVRSAKPSGNTYPCDSIRSAGDQCYMVDGQQTITIAPLPAALDFKGTYGGKRSRGLFVDPFVDSLNQTIHPYYTILFTDSANTREKPLRNLLHAWSFADPSDPGHPYWHKTDDNECPDGVSYCAVNVKETGTMDTQSRVNGTYQSDGVSIYCRDTLTVLNSDGVRQGLMAVNDSSGYPSKPETDRVERAFLIVQDSVTPGAEPYVWFFPKAANADGCQVGDSFLDWSGRPVNTRVLAGGHAHAFNPGDIVVCKDSTGQVKRDKDGNIIFGTVQLGASTFDWNHLRFVNIPNLNPGTVLPIKEYAVKGNEVLILDPSKPEGSEQLPGGSFIWPTKGRCAWPKRTNYLPET